MSLEIYNENIGNNLLSYKIKMAIYQDEDGNDLAHLETLTGDVMKRFRNPLPVGW